MIKGRIDTIVERISAIIRRAHFTKKDIIDGTEGQCASFALALHHTLEKIGCPSKLVIAGFKGDPEGWQHVMVRVRGNLYDIRGKVSSEQINKEFTTDIIRVVSEEFVKNQINQLKFEKNHAYDRRRDRYSNWLKRLNFDS